MHICGKMQKSYEIKMLSDHFTFLETNIIIYFLCKTDLNLFFYFLIFFFLFRFFSLFYTPNISLDKERYTITWVQSSCLSTVTSHLDLRPCCRNVLSNCFYSMTHRSFPSLDDPWRTGCHYDDLFSASALCDPQFLCLDFARNVWNGWEWKGAVLSLQSKQISDSDHGDFRKLFSVLIFLFFFFAVCGGPSLLPATQRRSLCQSCMLERQHVKSNIHC